MTPSEFVTVAHVGDNFEFHTPNLAIPNTVDTPSGNLELRAKSSHSIHQMLCVALNGQPPQHSDMILERFGRFLDVV